MEGQEENELAELNDRQKRFVEQYCIHFNASRAAREAGYSENTAAVIGCENLTKPNIKAAIAAIIQEKTMSAEEAISRLSEMARGDMNNFLKLDEFGNVSIYLTKDKNIQNLGLIKKIKQTKRSFGEENEITELYTELELHDQKDAILKILQMHGKLGGKVDITTNGESINSSENTQKILDNITKVLNGGSIPESGE